MTARPYRCPVCESPEHHSHTPDKVWEAALRQQERADIAEAVYDSDDAYARGVADGQAPQRHAIILAHAGPMRTINHDGVLCELLRARHWPSEWSDDPNESKWHTVPLYRVVPIKEEDT